MTSSTVSRESAPRSSMNLASGVTWSAFTPNCSTIMSLTRCSIDFSAMINSDSNFCCVSMPRFRQRQALNQIIFTVFRQPRGLHDHTTVNCQYLSGNITGGRAGQKQGRVGDIFRLSEFRQRDLLQNTAANFLIERRGHVCFYKTGRQG